MSARKPGRLSAARQWQLVALAAAVGFAAVVWWVLPRPEAETVEVRVPALSSEAETGKLVFAERCAQCHGANAGGTTAGPPLVHRYYEPNHHADASFYRAIAFGVQAHHWRFGNMPAQEGVGEAEAQAIVRYVRELQKANGIF